MGGILKLIVSSNLMSCSTLVASCHQYSFLVFRYSNVSARKKAQRNCYDIFIIGIEIPRVNSNPPSKHGLTKLPHPCNHTNNKQSKQYSVKKFFIEKRNICTVKHIGMSPQNYSWSITSEVNNLNFNTSFKILCYPTCPTRLSQVRCRVNLHCTTGVVDMSHAIVFCTNRVASLSGP